MKFQAPDEGRQDDLELEYSFKFFALKIRFELKVRSGRSGLVVIDGFR